MSEIIADQDLGENEDDEWFTFPPAERKVVTQPLDLSVHTLVDQWQSGVLQLPEIQREYLWDNGKASRLIESLLLNIPVPVLYFAETAQANYEIIDGHQRVASIARYLANEFALSGLAVLREYQGMRYHQLPDRERRFLQMRTLRAIIILIDSAPAMKFEIFERLNTGSISLNAQELRNSIYHGPLNRALHDLAKDENLRAMIGTHHPRRRMVDEELVLRFLALREGISTYRPPLKRFLNDYMRSFAGASPDQLADTRSLFEQTTRRARLLLGEKAFRLFDANGRTLDRAINRALFDAQMLACSWVVSPHLDNFQSRVLHEVGNLSASPEFLDAIQRATGDRSRTLRRVRDTVRALETAGLEVTTPSDLAA